MWIDWFLTVILGDQPALMPAELLYQRVVARDPVEASEQARKFLREKPLLAYYEDVLLEGLKLAAADAERGLLDPERTLLIRDAVAEIVDDLSDHKDDPEPADEAAIEAGEPTPIARTNSAGDTPRELAQQKRSGRLVLCIPGLGLIDEALALIVTQLLERRGVGARAEEAGALSKTRISSLDTKDVALICLCYMETPTPPQIHYAVRRLRRKAPAALILIALLGGTIEIDDEEVIHALVKLDLVKASLRATVERILEISPPAPSEHED